MRSSEGPVNVPSKYSVVKGLGEGSFGRAWLVKHKPSAQLLAMKEMRPASRGELVGALAEAERLSQLKHEHIIRYVDAFVKGSSVYIIMEYAQQGTLQHQLEQHRRDGKRIPKCQVVKWTFQLCLALRYIHGLAMVHRDIKALNCFLSADGSIRLGDFGTARKLERNHAASGHEPGKRTCSTPVGTPMYMSPELCCGRSYGQKADVWALGCLLYELLTLRHAFFGASMERLTAAIRRGQYDNTRYPELYGQSLTSLCNDLLAAEPHNRPTISAVMKRDVFAQHMSDASTAQPGRDSTKLPQLSGSIDSSLAPPAASSPPTRGPPPAPAKQRAGAGAGCREYLDRHRDSISMLAAKQAKVVSPAWEPAVGRAQPQCLDNIPRAASRAQRLPAIAGHPRAAGDRQRQQHEHWLRPRQHRVQLALPLPLGGGANPVTQRLPVVC